MLQKMLLKTVREYSALPNAFMIKPKYVLEKMLFDRALNTGPVNTGLMSRNEPSKIRSKGREKEVINFSVGKLASTFRYRTTGNKKLVSFFYACILR